MLAGCLVVICLFALSWSSQTGQAYPHKTTAEYLRNHQQGLGCFASWKMPQDSLPTRLLFGRRIESAMLKIKHPAKAMLLGFRLM